MEIYHALARKYGFEIPSDYRTMHRADWFDFKRNEYLWIPEVEWMLPDEILVYEPADYHKLDFVPFAFTGAGDHWCWWPKEDDKAVVFCPHDAYEGKFYASSFSGLLYRRAIDYACNGFDNEDDARTRLRDWAVRLSEYWPAAWSMTLQELAGAPLIQRHIGTLVEMGLCTDEQNREIVRKHLDFGRLDEEFRWMLE